MAGKAELRAPCPKCGGTGIGGYINHYPTEAGQEAIRCELCDGVGRIPSPDQRPIERSPAAPAGEIEAAAINDENESSLVVAALHMIHELHSHLSEEQRPMSWSALSEDQAKRAIKAATIVWNAAAATRAAQERRLAVEMREACAAVANAEVARHNTGSGFDSSAAYTAACRIEVAIRALPIPGEEEKA